MICHKLLITRPTNPVIKNATNVTKILSGTVTGVTSPKPTDIPATITKYREYIYFIVHGASEIA